MKIKILLFYSFFIQNFVYSYSIYLPQDTTPTELLLRAKSSVDETTPSPSFSFIRGLLTFIYEFKNLYSTNSHEGIYSIKECTYEQLIQRIHQISQRQEKVRITPGLTTCQAIQRILHINSLYGFIPTSTQEGDLSTQPQYFSGMKTFHDIVGALKEHRAQTLNKYWNKIKDTEKNLKSPKDLLILSSLVEKETFHNPEKPTIAGVYKNRLATDMRLQCDPTVIYGITKGCQEMKRKLTYADLKVETDYNTYRKKGLPPTPICNPSEESIKSAAHHEHHDHIYFVASTKGHHRFSADFETHKKHKKIWLKELQELKNKKKN